VRARPFSFPLPFEGVPASLGPGLRTASGTKRSLGARSPGGTPAMTAESPHSQKMLLAVAIAEARPVARRALRSRLGITSRIVTFALRKIVLSPSEKRHPFPASASDVRQYFPNLFSSSGIRGCGEKRRRAGQPLAWGLTTVGAKNGKKHAESSHWLSFATMPGEDRPFTELWPAAGVASSWLRAA